MSVLKIDQIFITILMDNTTDFLTDLTWHALRAIVANISDKGLVILTGCAGIVNPMNYAKKIAGINRIHAVVGGFHLPADGWI